MNSDMGDLTDFDLIFEVTGAFTASMCYRNFYQHIKIICIYFPQGLDAHKYKNTAHCAMMIYKNEGPRA